MITMHALKTVATQALDSALTKEILAMTTMYVPRTAAILPLESAHTLQFLALMEMHVPLILVMQLKDASTLLNITSKNCKKTTNATPMFATVQLETW
jgi:hypothetical protein